MEQSRNEPVTIRISESVVMQFTSRTIMVSLHAVWSTLADEEIRRAVRQSLKALPSDQPWNVVVDLNEIEIAPSRVLGLLVMFARHANQCDGKMAISNVSDLTYEKMQRFNLADLWLITGSTSDAILAVENST